MTTVKSERDARQSLAILTKGGRDLLSDVAAVLNDFLNGLGVEDIDDEKLTVLEQVLMQMRNRR